MKIYNSLSNKTEEFIPIKENEVMMYVCGPTVYNDPHIGNARPLIVFDMVYRVLCELGYKVKYVSNYTDIDDKIINRALELNTTAKDVAETYIKAYEDLSESLNIKAPEKIKVTDTMESIKAFIQALIDDGYAYEVNGDVYFRVTKVKDYGVLSNQNVDDLLVGARIEENTLKEDPLDFTLWKKTEVGEKFDGTWSQGRPGWHTECVVMIEESFGGVVDIHGGGLDLKFPHHENELAQASVGKHEHLANYWMHNGLINIGDSKMSKSSGTMILAKDMVKDLGYETVRWFMLSTHYRAPLRLTDEYIDSSVTELKKLLSALDKAYATVVLQGDTWHKEWDENLVLEFLEPLKDDFNTSNAYKVIFDTLKLLNAALRSGDKDYEEIVKISESLIKMLDILGIEYRYKEIIEEDKNNYKAWNEAKKEKDFETADTYRQLLMEKGLI